jgi:hypothetical protein
MNRKELFERLGAPLWNYQWSWGADRQEDRSVFLCVWADKIRHIDGASFVPVTNFGRPDTTAGHREREEHLNQVQNGAPCYLIICCHSAL